MAEYGQLPGQQFYLELTIGETRFNPINLEYLVIKEWIFNLLPTIELVIIDDGYLQEHDPLEDGEDIEVVIAKSEDDENPKQMTFVVDNYNIGIIGDNRKSSVAITGHLKADQLFNIQTKSFSQQNSSRVLSQIANEVNLTFSNPRNVIPSDTMNWYQLSQSNYDFVYHVLKRSYIPDDTLFFYGNTEGQLVLTSLLSEINKQNIKRSKFSIENYERFAELEEDPDNTVWFNNYSIVNYSGYYNKKIGYGFSYSYYDLDNVINQQYNNINKLTDLSFRNSNQVESVIDNPSMMDYIEPNLYSEKYFESILRNKFLKENFFANSLVLNINSLSQIDLMDIIDVDIPSTFDREEKNDVMSGFYLVAGIQHEVSSGGIYKKKIAIGRNGMNKSEYINFYKVES